MDRRRYDSAMFWLAFGTAAAVIGLALMTIGVTRTPGNANPISSAWFDGGLVLLVIGAVLLLWALWLFLGRRRAAVLQSLSGTDSTAVPTSPEKQAEAEAVRGYYAERERLFRLYERQQKEKGKKDSAER